MKKILLSLLIISITSNNGFCMLSNIGNSIYNNTIGKIMGNNTSIKDDEKMRETILSGFKTKSYDLLNNNQEFVYSITSMFFNKDLNDKDIITKYKEFLIEQCNLKEYKSINDVLNNKELEQYVIDILHKNIYAVIYYNIIPNNREQTTTYISQVMELPIHRKTLLLQILKNQGESHVIGNSIQEQTKLISQLTNNLNTSTSKKTIFELLSIICNFKEIFKTKYDISSINKFKEVFESISDKGVRINVRKWLQNAIDDCVITVPELIEYVRNIDNNDKINNKNTILYGQNKNEINNKNEIINNDEDEYEILTKSDVSNILNEDAILCEKHKNELLKFADWSYTALLNSNQAEVVRDSLITPYNKEEVIQRYRNYLNKKCNNSKFNYLLDQKSELYKIINDILIINIYQYYHCWNNFGILKNNMKFLSENNNPYYGMYDSLNDGFEIYQNDVIYNILYELTDYDKKELLTFKDLTYEILSKSESKDIIITKFCSNTSDFDIIKEYFTIIAGSKLGNKLQETLKKYKLKNYIIDILNFNIYKFMCQYYISNNDKINEIKYNVNIPNNRAQQWEMLYTIMSNDNLETNKDCPLEMQKWIQCVLKEDYFGMVNAEFNCVKNVMNDDQKQRIAYDYITNPKIIEYIKPMIIKQYIEKNN